ncbi:MAG: NTP transferase domain-containing protein [Deltaproteobacteria bacterium]|nr:NTP transferase domain-containing protein [Deltaproteobacteria bacterium]
MRVSHVLCAAGEGSRFRPLFGGLPKPLIKVGGATMLEWSIKSLPLFSGDTLVIVTQRKHRVRERMEAVLSAAWPFVFFHWEEIDVLTGGQLETASLVENRVDPAQPILIYNCDTYFESRTLAGLMHDAAIDGIIPCVLAEGEAWSFCAVDEQDAVLAVREKERISPWATVGLYFFRSAREFFALAGASLAAEEKTRGEYYVAPLYEKLIRQGKRVVMDRASFFKPMGTPEQLEEFWSADLQKLRMENLAPVMVIDLDNTITIEEPGISYAEKKPNLPVIKKMRELADAGCRLIIHSSRRMETFGSDEARVVADIAEITLQWLKRHQVPFDGLRFGKPYARNGFYVDDKALRPEEFARMSLAALLESKQWA